MADGGTGTSLLVAAFDFGITYSGYAFSFRDNPLKVQTNQGWNAGSEKLISLKTSTCVLLNPKGKFEAFGFDAENKYASLADDGKHHGWRLFMRFKMLLHKNKNLSRSSTVEDLNGKSTQALPIFAMATCIRYMRDHLLEAIKKQTVDVLETDINYVLTIPAIWDDDAKQFMREAAIEADIDTHRMRLALEPEAASIWCEKINPDVKKALSGSCVQYMVVDLGGGTADISVHEKQPDGTLREIHKASGGPWGGIYVDENYVKFLEHLFSAKAIEQLKSDEMGEYFDILREFETKKRTFSPTSADKITFRTSSLLREISESITGQSFKSRIASLHFGDTIVLKGGDKLRVDPEIVRKWFDGPVNCVIKHMQELLAEPNMKKVNTMLLVGGFGESQYVQERLKTEISIKRLIVPDEAGLVVLKGAVRFGHEPSIVSSRVMKYTYGIYLYPSFDKLKHRPDKLFMSNGKRMAKDVFEIFVRKDDEVHINDEVTRYSFTPMEPTFTLLKVYRSPEREPVYVTDPGCELLGQLKIKHRRVKNIDTALRDVTFMFGDTELLVKILLHESGRVENMRLDCWK